MRKDDRNSEIYRLYKEDGVSMIDIAMSYGLSRSRVHAIIRACQYSGPPKKRGPAKKQLSPDEIETRKKKRREYLKRYLEERRNNEELRTRDLERQREAYRKRREDPEAVERQREYARKYYHEVVVPRRGARPRGQT